MRNTPRQLRGRKRPASPAPLALLAALLSGCQAAPSLTPVDRVEAPGLSLPLPGAGAAGFEAPGRRLLADVPRAIRGLGWGLEFSRPSSPMQAEQVSLPVLVQAQAVLPDGRRAAVFAWSEDGSRVELVVRVGEFGDPDLQQQFAGVLAGVLRGRAVRHRLEFRLPEWPELVGQ